MTHIMVVGSHSPDWNKALAPDSPVWREITDISTVSWCTALPSAQEPVLPLDGFTVVPMLEQDILASQAAFGLFPNVRQVHLISNKLRWMRFVASSGFQSLQPHFWVNPDLAHFPAFVKRVDLDAGQGVVRATSRDELDAILQTNLFLNHPFVIQESVEDEDDFATHAVCVRGEVKWATTIRYEDPPDFSGNPSGRGRRVVEECISESARTALWSLLRALKFDGPLCIDWRLKESVPQVLELNPRLGGSLMRPAFTSRLSQALGTSISHGMSPRQRRRSALGL